MRYLTCVIFVLLFLGKEKAQAQYYDQAIGFRAGTSFEASYKRFVFYTPNIQQAVEGLIGYHIDEWDKRYNGFVIEALYIVHLDLGFDTGFSGFAGGGLYGGVYVETGSGVDPYFGGGATIVVGASYTFTHAPVSISIDWKPLFGWPRYPYKSLARGGVTLRYVLPTTWQ